MHTCPTRRRFFKQPPVFFQVGCTSSKFLAWMTAPQPPGMSLSARGVLEDGPGHGVPGIFLPSKKQSYKIYFTNLPPIVDNIGRRYCKYKVPVNKSLRRHLYHIWKCIWREKNCVGFRSIGAHPGISHRPPLPLTSTEEMVNGKLSKKSGHHRNHWIGPCRRR